MQCVDNILLRLFLYPKLIHLLYSDNSVDNSRFSVNDKIFAKERENTTVFHPGTIVQILENEWINIRWDWKGFSHGSTSRVHESWIRNSNESRPRTDMRPTPVSIVLLLAGMSHSMMIHNLKLHISVVPINSFKQ